MHNILKPEMILPIINTLDVLLNFDTMAFYIKYNKMEFVLNEVYKNTNSKDIPDSISNDLLILKEDKWCLNYTYTKNENEYNYYISINNDKKKSVGILFLHRNKELSGKDLKMINRYIVYIQEEVIVPRIFHNKGMKWLINDFHIVENVYGNDAGIVFFQDIFVNKSLGQLFNNDRAEELYLLIKDAQSSQRKFLYIYSIKKIERIIDVYAFIEYFPNKGTIFTTFISDRGGRKPNDPINYKFSALISYSIRYLLNSKNKNYISIIKAIINGMGIIDNLDYSNVTVMNDCYNIIYQHSWPEEVSDENSLLKYFSNHIFMQSLDKPIIIYYPDQCESYEEFGIKENVLNEQGIKSFILVPFNNKDKHGFLLLMSYKKIMQMNTEIKQGLITLGEIISSIIPLCNCIDENRIKEYQYDKLIEKSPDLLIRFDGNYKIVYTNNTIEKYSLDKESILGKVIFDGNISTKIFLDKYIEYLHFMTVYKNDQEISFRTKDRKFVRVRIIPELNEYDKVCSGLIIISDLTNYMNMAEEIDENKEKLKLAVEASNGIIWDIDTVDGKIAYAGNIKELLNLQSNNVDVKKIIRPEQYKRIKREIVEYLKEVKKNKNKKLNYEVKIMDGIGDYKWFLITGRAAKWEDNKVTNIMGMAIDITDAKKREQQIKYMAEHDALTGLYNRNYFEDSLVKIDTKLNYPIGIMIIDVDGLKLINDAFGHHMGDNLIESTGKILANTFSKKVSIVSRIGGDEFSVLISKTTMEELEFYSKTINNLLLDEKVVSITPSVSIGYAIKEKPYTNINNIYKVAEDMMYKSKLLKSTSTRSTIIKSLQKALGEKTHETEEHCSRIKHVAVAIAKKMAFSDSLIDDVILLSNLHDIGKIAIPDNILNKPDKLNEDEWKIMKTHCEIGYRIASSTKDIYSIAEGILSHHERWDGKGYPRGLKGLEIPLISRLISVVDAFDAMTNNRVYRKALSEDEAFKEIINNSGTQFDPKIVEIFKEIQINK